MKTNTIINNYQTLLRGWNNTKHLPMLITKSLTRNLSTTSLGINLISPHYITGFSDGESSFIFSITPKIIENTNKKTGNIQTRFMLVAGNNLANLQQFKAIQNFFGVGRISFNKETIIFIVDSLKDCLIVRKHFDNYPLLTTKLVHYKIWAQVLDLKIKNEHLTEEGINKIVALKLHSPKGLSDKLKTDFPNYINYISAKPEYNPNFNNLNIDWISGFMQADSCFKVGIMNSPASKLGKACKISITITQHSDNLLVLEKIKEFLNMGKIYPYKNRNAYDFIIQNIKDANDFIEKFKYTKLLGAKSLDYFDFCKIIDIMNKKLHLTKEGLAQIAKINANVNSQRTDFSTKNI